MWSPTPDRRTKDGGVRVAAHPPTSQPQTCSKCSARLPADHFAIDAANRTGRQSRCRACVHDDDRRRSPLPVAVKSKECLGCGETQLAAAFARNPLRQDGLHTYCRPCDNERSRSSYRTRAQPRQPPPRQLACGGPCGEVKPVNAFPKRRNSLFGVDRICRECLAAKYASVKSGAAGGGGCEGGVSGSDSGRAAGGKNPPREDRLA